MSNPTFTGSNSTNGAGASREALSVPQLDPVFSYFLRDGGEIYIYVFDTGVSKTAVITLDDTSSEVAYACRTILSANIAHALVWDAIEDFEQDGEDTPNPFRELLEDKEVMQKLNDLLAKIFYGE